MDLAPVKDQICPDCQLTSRLRYVEGCDWNNRGKPVLRCPLDCPKILAISKRLDNLTT